MAWSRSGLLLLGAVAVTGCSTSSSEPPSAAKPATGKAVALNLTPRIAHVNETFNAPSFAWLDSSQLKIPAHATAVDVAWGTLRAIAPSFKLAPSAVAGARITHVHDIGRGAIITRFGQSLGGVDVFRSRMSVAMTRDLKPISASGSLAPALVSLANGWTLDEKAAVAAAYRAQTSSSVSTDTFSANGSDGAGHARYLFNTRDASGILYVSARVKKVYFPEAKAFARPITSSSTSATITTPTARCARSSSTPATARRCSRTTWWRPIRTAIACGPIRRGRADVGRRKTALTATSSRRTSWTRTRRA